MLLDSSSGNSRSWISRDGIHWRASTMQSSLSDAEMNAVTRGDSGYVAVGSDGFPRASTQLGGASGAMVWTSPDGLTWTRVPGSRELAGGLMRGIVASRWGWFAYGSDLPLSQGVSLPPLWHSSDGWRWERDRKIAFPGFYRAIHALAPKCAHCGCQIVGHGVEAEGRNFCCDHCAHAMGARSAAIHA